MAAFGIKKCENVLVAAICELAELRAPFSAPPPHHTHTQVCSKELSSGGESEAVAYGITVKMRVKNAFASVRQMVKELVFLSQNFLDPLAGTIWIIVSSFCVVLTRSAQVGGAVVVQGKLEVRAWSVVTSSL